ncbi:MAG: DNA-3-methyladenine glycosylase 2 family protein [Clostridia bacterium]|nr:DNA-3-methyladenine glycosylase 2 family protein [Clostridia bacterium]MBR4955106.1 DNA-3-methyladenine glycosylase 2 family protein [Clostridia bacterium]
MYKINTFDNKTEISGIDFDIRHTCDCGQCFRFMPCEGGYLGVAYGKPIFVEHRDRGAVFHCTQEDFEQLWREFFDLDTDYGSIAAALPQDNFTRSAVEFGRGLRILRQQPWEALCSFIISQCNNIPRIQSIIDRLCRLFGEEIEWQGNTLYTFPSAERLAQLTAEDLAPLRCGYRAPYIINAAKTVSANDDFFDRLAALDTVAARKKIMELEGVGPKVADCFLLFGMHKLDAFPVDTWMKKAAVYYGGKFDPSRFGEYAGIAQQYIFYYARSGNGTVNT